MSQWCDQNICYSWWVPHLMILNHQDLWGHCFSFCSIFIVEFVLAGIWYHILVFYIMVFVVYGFCKVCFYSSCGTPHVICCCCCKLACLSWCIIPCAFVLNQELEEKRKEKAKVAYERRKQLAKLRVKAEKAAEEKLGSQLKILAPIKYWEAVFFCASPVLLNILPLTLSSLVKLCDSII